MKKEDAAWRSGRRGSCWTAIAPVWEAACRGFGVSDFIFPPAPSLTAFAGSTPGLSRSCPADLLDHHGRLRHRGRGRRAARLPGGLVAPDVHRALSADGGSIANWNCAGAGAGVWFGIGTLPAILTAFICFFPITVNVATGLATIEPELGDAGARRVRTAGT